MSYPAVLAEALKHPDTVFELDLSGENLESLPSAIGALGHIQSLDISYNALKAFPQELWSLQNLERLAFSTVEDRIPDEIGSLPKLRSLAISRWSDEPPTEMDLPSTLENLERLEELKTLDLPLREFPKVLCRLPSLQVLQIIGGELRDLPLCIGNMVRLTQLIAARAGVHSIPASLSRLRRLEHLQIDDAPALRMLPIELSSLRRLRTLSLSSCGFEAVPECISELKGLESLTLSHNPLTWLPRLDNLNRLKQLYLDHCKLTDIPPEIWKLPALEIVSLTGNTFSQEGYGRAKAALARGFAVEMPRTQRISRVKRQAKKHLSPKVVDEIRRLGGRDRSDLGPAPEIANPAGKAYPLPQPLRELVYKHQFSDSHVKVDLPGISAVVRLAPETDELPEYEAFSNRPYLLLGYTEHHSLIVIALDDPNPSDPTLQFLDADDYTATEARDLGVTLSRFLNAAHLVSPPSYPSK